MHLAISVLIVGILCAIVSGILNGVSTIPMRYLGRLPWENFWLLMMAVACVVLPTGMAVFQAPHFMDVFRAAPPRVIFYACITGFAWGFGAIMFGQGVSAIGISMGNTLALAISSSFGSVLPILVLAPNRLFLSQGKAIAAGTLIGIVGIVCFGYAGFRREESQKSNAQKARGDMVGHARPFAIGLLLCIGSGFMSAVFNIGYSLAQPLMDTAVHMGYSQFAGTSLIWLLMLGCGFLPTLGFCGRLLYKNGTWRQFAAPGSLTLYLLVLAVALMWWSHVNLYGFASPYLGKLGPAIGWPLTLMVGLITVNAYGFLAGEWDSTRPQDRRWMGAGILITMIAIAVLGWSSTLG